jgi:hypothetical protein
MFVASFFVVGALPFLTLFHVLPKNAQVFGQDASFLSLAIGVGLLAAGVYMTRLLFHRIFPRSIPDWSYRSLRILADLILASLAVPLHWWLFSRQQAAGSSTGLILPGGIVLFANLKFPFDPTLNKVIVGVLVLLMDTILVSEILGLGLVRWVSGGRKRQ